MKKDTTAKLFPIYSIENDFLISKNGDISLAYKITLPKIYTLTQCVIEKINHSFNTIICSLPKDSIIQKQDYFFVNNTRGHNSVKTSADLDLSHEKALLHHECYLFITKEAKNKIGLYSSQKAYTEYIEEINDFVEKVAFSISLLEQCECFKIKKLDDDQIIKILGQYFSLSKEGTSTIEDYYFDKEFKIDNKIGEIYTFTASSEVSQAVKSLQSHTNEPTTDFTIPFIQPLSLSLECNHIYNQVIYISKQDVLVPKLKQLHYDVINLNDSEFNYPDSIEELVDTISDKGLQFIELHCNIMLWDEEEEKLQIHKERLKKQFKTLGIIPYQIKQDLKELFIYNIPGAAANIPDNYKFIKTSDQASLLLNLESYHRGNRDGILLNDKKTAKPIRLDLWETPVDIGLIKNRNRLVFGAKEKGEAILINHVMAQYHEQGHQIMMIDIDNTYEMLSEELKGNYIPFDLAIPLQFNPFYVENKEQPLTEEKKEILVAIIQLICQSNGFNLSKQDTIQLTAYIELFYNYTFDNQSAPCFISFYEFLKNSTLKKTESNFKGEQIIAALKVFLDGAYKNIFNNSNAVAFLKNRLNIINLNTIKEHALLYPLVTLLCIDAFANNSTVATPIQKKSLFINECWKSISNTETSQAINALYCITNKTNSELVLMTTEVEDIINCAMKDMIIDNTETIIMLNPSKTKNLPNKLATHFSFTASDCKKLFSLSDREVFLKIGKLSNIYVLEEILCRLPSFTTPINLNNNYY